MAGTIKLPGVGPVKKSYAIAGAGLLGGILVYAYWKRSQAPADLTEATPDGTADSGTDTGYVEDSAAAGYNQIYSGGYYPYNPQSNADSATYANNNEWATAAESALEGAGISLAVSTLAISRVLGGLSVTSDQRDLFLQAKGLLGEDPPNGYPTPIKLTDNGSGPSVPKGTVLPAPKGLKATSPSPTHLTLSWGAVAGAASYRMYRSDVSVAVGVSNDTKGDIGGLAHNHTYHVHVRAVAPDGTLGAPSASVSGRTKK